MNKKETLIIIFAALFFVGLIGVVSAASISQDLTSILKELEEVSKIFFGAILGESNTGAMFFERCLLLLIIYGIIYSVLKNMDFFSSSPFILPAISGAVAVLGIRFLSTEIINSILLPYGALGGSIAIFLPFLIYFFFVHTSVRGTFGRRAAWILFAIVFAAIWVSRRSGGLISGNSFDYMYVVGFILVIISLIFDESIHKYFGLSKMSKAISNFHQQQTRAALRDLRQLEIDYRHGTVNAADYEYERKRLERLIKKGAGQL